MLPRRHREIGNPRESSLRGDRGRQVPPLELEPFSDSGSLGMPSAASAPKIDLLNDNNALRGIVPPLERRLASVPGPLRARLVAGNSRPRSDASGSRPGPTSLAQLAHEQPENADRGAGAAVAFWRKCDSPFIGLAPVGRCTAGSPNPAPGGGSRTQCDRTRSPSRRCRRQRAARQGRS